ESFRKARRAAGDDLARRRGRANGPLAERLDGGDEGGPVLGGVLLLLGEGGRPGRHQGERVVQDVVRPTQRAPEGQRSCPKQELSPFAGIRTKHGHPVGQFWKYIGRPSSPFSGNCG